MPHPTELSENTTLRVADDAVTAEFDLHGTHQGTLRGVSASTSTR